MSSLPLEADLLCGHCSQNLRQVASDRCPECGHRFARARLLTSAIPWEHRRQIGRFRAYWRTARLVSFLPARLVTETITLAAARSFRRWTVALLFITLLVPALVWKNSLGWKASPPGLLYRLFRDGQWPDAIDDYQNPWLLGTATATVLLGLIAITGMAGWFLHRKGLPAARQKQAVAAGLYACAPLAWMTPLAMLTAVFRWLMRAGDGVNPAFNANLAYHISAQLEFVSFVSIAVLPVIWWALTIFIIQRTQGSVTRTILAALLLPILWAVSIGIIFLSLLFLVNHAALLIYAAR